MYMVQCAVRAALLHQSSPHCLGTGLWPVPPQLQLLLQLLQQLLLWQLLHQLLLPPSKLPPSCTLSASQAPAATRSPWPLPSFPPRSRSSPCTSPTLYHISLAANFWRPWLPLESWEREVCAQSPQSRVSCAGTARSRASRQGAIRGALRSTPSHLASPGRCLLAPCHPSYRTVKGVKCDFRSEGPGVPAAAILVRLLLGLRPGGHVARETNGLRGMAQTLSQLLARIFSRELMTVSWGGRERKGGAGQGCRIASASMTRVFLAASFSAVCMTGSLLYADSSVVAESPEIGHNFTTTLPELEEQC